MLKTGFTAGNLVICLLSAAFAMPLSADLPSELHSADSLSLNQRRWLSQLFGNSKTSNTAKESNTQDIPKPWEVNYIEGQKSGKIADPPFASIGEVADTIAGELLRQFALQKHGSLPSIEFKHPYSYVQLDAIYFTVTGPPECQPECYGYAVAKESKELNPVSHLTQGDLRPEPKAYPIWTFIRHEPTSQWNIVLQTRMEFSKYDEYAIAVFLRAFWIKQLESSKKDIKTATMPRFHFERHLSDDLPRYSDNEVLFKLLGPPECDPVCFGEVNSAMPSNPYRDTEGTLRTPSKLLYGYREGVAPMHKGKPEIYAFPLPGFGEELSRWERTYAHNIVNDFLASDGAQKALDTTVPKSRIRASYPWNRAQKQESPYQSFLHFSIEVMRLEKCGGQCTGVVAERGGAGTICNVHGVVIYERPTDPGHHYAEFHVVPDCTQHYDKVNGKVRLREIQAKAG